MIGHDIQRKDSFTNTRNKVDDWEWVGCIKPQAHNVLNMLLNFGDY